MSDEFNENDNNDNDFESDADETTNSTVEWIKENLRIVVSVLIVLLIAGGIYSYSKRSDSTIEVVNEPTEESAIENMLDDLSEEGIETSGNENIADDTTDAEKVAVKEESTETPVVATEAPAVEKAVSEQAVTAQETEKSFVEKAQTGDGTTKLARRALSHYLEKNPDSNLTAEHKIYIEDYLQKKVSHQGGLAIGQTVEFSKSLISEAIASSKNLNESQLQNLQQYSANVQF